MWRVLVPLDGSELAASVILDARRLAGPGGTVILVMDVAASPALSCDDGIPGQAGRRYLDSIARALEADGFHVETHVFDLGDPSTIIERAAAELKADFMALATRALPVEQRWQRGSVAWTALLRSTVPVLLRRAGSHDGVDPTRRRILVPLDGSRLAESALPLAQALVMRWKVPIWLVNVVADEATVEEITATESYLAMIAEGLAGEVHTLVGHGATVRAIAAEIAAVGITDVVMTSHGRTGLTRAIVGTVADELIHSVDCPIIVIPPLLTLGEGLQEPLRFSRDLAPAL